MAQVLEVGKGGAPPLLPWTAGTEEISEMPADHAQEAGWSPDSAGGDRSSGGTDGPQYQGMALERGPPQRKERMLNSTGQLLSPGRMLR